ncbi:inner membrane protein YhjD [Nocardia sp. alder85J]|uniref:inner membrane protein YhjD n=1 Tax=Nocardia sp. alder85J TaxID=2862949 RepID=UPI001CD432F4|nr:inner membrane protein YhjD [Nocardia sp. alder85J]MCX4097230.1 inner membrane protein YhjD [Nocardia sp. alder85J]
MLSRVRARLTALVRARPWLAHIVRAGGRYQRQRANYYAAGLTYFTVLALFPMLMVGFAVAGFVLSHNPHLLSELENRIVQSMPGSLGDQVNELIDEAVRSRTSVGVLGLLGAGYAGLGWMANLRAALGELWEQPAPDGNWFGSKISDLLALLGLAAAMLLSTGLSALSSSNLGLDLLKLVHLERAPGVNVLLTITALVLAVVATWAVFAWVIARLPRQPVRLVDAAQAALIAAVAFEIWKQVASFYLKRVLTSPAGVAFGPIIGLMVFANITSRIILFTTAWAATAADTRETVEPQQPPPPAVISPRARAGLTPSTGVVLFGAGAVIGLLARSSRRSAK